MVMGRLSLSGTLLLVLASGVVGAAPQKHDARGDSAALAKMLAQQNDCDDPQNGVEINDLKYFDFGHSGSEKLIVLASTCNTGTAGPDVHSVFARNPDGTFSELPVPDVDQKYFDGMVGNRNYDLSVRKGELVAMWHDRSGRPLPPLTITYRWNGSGFEVKSIRAPYMGQSAGK